ncbi:hypothetical protein BJ978_002701 [Agromyces terreus]|uniref:Fe-S oxidoreductase n=1 Tax=Agromyces terreus TaxID=424795 RepID=A0A9X2KD84_9MICO|nr:hypothetical protein [Agromyces terreus]MCP2372025.1 hypothetical protein [Agromyces terreus]
MQLGTRWAFGAPPPASVPEALGVRLAAVEADRPAAGGHWTLTWLEGRPIAELDDGTRVTLDDSSPAIDDEDPDDDW